MGPRQSAGKNVSAATTVMTPVNVSPNVQPWVGSVPDEASTVFWEASLPTIASAEMMGTKRPIKMTMPAATL